MALYRRGKVTLDANGLIKGFGTKWMEKLSLIRTGATMIIASNPVTYLTISEIIDDTTMRAINTGGAVVGAQTDYIILIHDSLTVDGLAQDVAETLRYYQGKESEFAHFIDIVKTLDYEKIEELINKMKEETDKFEQNFFKIEQKAQEVQANAAKVADDLAVVQTIHVRVDELAEQAKANADRANENFVLSQDEVRKARQEADNATGEAVKAKSQADRAQGIVDAAKDEVVQSAAEQVTLATAQADRAQREADRAADLAAGFEGSNMLRKDLNLSDVQDAAAARRNIGAANVELIYADDNETRLNVKGSDYWIVAHKDNGTWGFYNGVTHEFVPLGVEQGGTGGNTPAEARLNLDLNRFEQTDTRTSMNSPGGRYAIEVDDDGTWGITDGDHWGALGVEQGGTGANNAADARDNLDIDRFIQDENMTRIKSSDAKTEMRIGFDDWYVYRDSQDSEAGFVALGVKGGGTGATDAAGARANLSVPEVNYIGMTTTGVIQDADANNITKNCFFAGQGAGAKNYGFDYGPGIAMRRVNTVGQMQMDDLGNVRWRGGNLGNGAWSEWKRAVAQGDPNIQLDTNTDVEMSSSGMVTGRCMSATGGTIRHYYRIYSEVRSDKVGYLTLHLRGPNGVNRYFGFDENGGLSGINTIKVGDTLTTARNLEVMRRRNSALGASERLNNLRGSNAGFYYQTMTANATQANTYPSITDIAFTPSAGAFWVVQNAANGGEGCSQFYDQFTGVGGMKFRRLKPDGGVTDGGGHNGWREFLTDNGDVVGGPAGNKTQSSFDNVKNNNIAFGYGDGANGNSTSGTLLQVANVKFNRYPFQLHVAYQSARAFIRARNGDNNTWTGWKEITTAAVSDATLKDIKGNLNLEGALDNINRMEFKLFRFKDDKPEKSARRGVISQQIKTIDKEYVKKVGDILTLDQTPMLLDGLAAIKALRKRDEENKERIAKLESEVAELKEIVAALLNK